MQPIPAFEPDPADVRRHVTETYTTVARSPLEDLHFPVGRRAATFVGYPAADLDALPELAVESFAGVGFPFGANGIAQGDTVLDIGSGSGTDLLLAASRVGREGRAIGLDFTGPMLEKALRSIREARAFNAFLVEGDAGERIPLPSGSVDVVTSNGVINLIPDKHRVFSEAHRVLAPRGRLQICDIIVHVPIPTQARCDGELWAACIAGADEEAVYLDAIRAAGFEDVQVSHRFDYFAGAPSVGARKTAARYRAEAITVTARRAD